MSPHRRKAARQPWVVADREGARCRRLHRQIVVALVATLGAGLGVTGAIGVAIPTTSGAAGSLGDAHPTVTPQDRTPAALTPRTVTGPGACAATAAAAATVVSSTPVDHVACTWQVTPQDRTHPIALSSPTPVTLNGTPAVVVGDRAGNVYAYNLSTGTPVWSKPAHIETPITGERGVPIDTAPSVDPAGDLFVGAGNALYSDTPAGGYYSISPAGRVLWHTSVQDPSTDAAPATGVQASLTVATLDGTESVAAGSLDQEGYALDARDGAPDTGWPFFDSDSVFATAAVADLYGTGADELVEGAAQTKGFGDGQLYTTGGHIRILSAQGNLVCHYDSTQSINSSPAVGDFLAGGQPGIVVGTGNTFPGASQTDMLLAFNNRCGLQWETSLDGTTTSSPALADVTGTGQLDAVEGTIVTDNTGTVYVIDAATGAIRWSAKVTGAVIGSITTANLTGGRFQDLLVPTTRGVDIVSGTGALKHPILAVLDGGTRKPSTPQPRRLTALGPYALAFQNSPLVTVDPNGEIGITVAGYGGPGTGAGYVTHFEIPATPGVDAVGRGTWPEFHHDPQLSGDAGNFGDGPNDPAATAACQVPSDIPDGYELVGADSGVYAYGNPFCGSTATHPLNKPIVGAASAPGTGGYWLVASDGGVFAYGGAVFYGSMGGRPLNAPIVAMAATPDGKGYWLVASDGGIFAFGDAQYYGSMGGSTLYAPIVGIAATPDGLGYRLVASDGGIFDFGQDTRTQYFGSMGGQQLAAPIVGMADDQATGGYWLVASDGGVFAFNAPFFGSTGALKLASPVVGMLATQNGAGYRFVGADGGVFAYAAASFLGSTGAQHINAPIVAIAG